MEPLRRTSKHHELFGIFQYKLHNGSCVLKKGLALSDKNPAAEIKLRSYIQKRMVFCLRKTFLPRKVAKFGTTLLSMKKKTFGPKKFSVTQILCRFFLNTTIKRRLLLR